MSGTTGGYDQNALLLALMNAGGSGQQQSPMPQQSSLLNALAPGGSPQQWQTPNIFGYGNMGAGTPNAQPAGGTTGGTPNSTALPQQMQGATY